ncbi:AMP-binding protein [Brevibacillus agri]|uniref:AMP-binding protein n=1 Tax=Brevibacillus agri TaxID=51101 RepID=UPI0024C06B09|nr:AMP-binding protein [Brevibacillus agri]WHX32063.1 AMP-binding protein [Brevibacillus agri]
MRIAFLLATLYKMKLLTPAGIGRLLAAVCRYGTNLMTLLQVAQRTYGQKIALADEREAVSFRQLWCDSERLAWAFREKYGLARGKKVGLLCQNHMALVKAIFAASGTGCDIYLLNPEMSARQLAQLLDETKLDLLVHDANGTARIEQAAHRTVRLHSYHDQLPAINRLLHEWHGTAAATPKSPKRASAGRIMLLTGGTTGQPKKVAHKPSLFRYLPPFLALLTRLRLLGCHTAYVATPICHGYGLAILLLFLALGKKIVITPGFDAANACALIEKHKVDAVTVVPLMLRKMLRHNASALQSLACIASGGAPLTPALAAEVSGQLGAVLFNLYGTSEAGLCAVATPQDLAAAPHTIGKKIGGVGLHVRGRDRQKLAAGEIGQLCVRRRRALFSTRTGWVETGDLGYRDERGYYFLCGRTDDMVVSGGENVYPIELERILAEHPGVEDAAVVGIPDEAFGQRLKAFVQPASYAGLTEEAVLDWLRPRVARYQLPKEIVFVDSIAYTDLGKPDRKQLV